MCIPSVKCFFTKSNKASPAPSKFCALQLPVVVDTCVNTCLILPMSCVIQSCQIIRPFNHLRSLFGTPTPTKARWAPVPKAFAKSLAWGEPDYAAPTASSIDQSHTNHTLQKTLHHPDPTKQHHHTSSENANSGCIPAFIYPQKNKIENCISTTERICATLPDGGLLLACAAWR